MSNTVQYCWCTRKVQTGHCRDAMNGVLLSLAYHANTSIDVSVMLLEECKIMKCKCSSSNIAAFYTHD